MQYFLNILFFTDNIPLMKNSIEKLNKIHDELINKKTYYQFNKTEELSQKYRNGRISASNWLADVIFMFIQKEKNFIKEFEEIIEKQKEDLSILKDGDYKKGLIDELDTIKDLLKKL